MAWPNVYTYNFCSNPSFEQDLTGVQSVNGGIIAMDYATGLYGAQSLQVTTPGQQANEGVILPPGTVLGSATGAVSFYLTGSTPTATGTLTAFAIDTTSSTTLGSVAVEFDPTLSWQRVQITGLALVNAHNIAVYIETVGTQQVQFNVDAVQYEPTLTLNAGVLPTPYVDGDQLYGVWVGAVAESASYQPYQFMITGVGGIHTSGDGALLQRGAIFSLVNADPASGPTTVAGNIDLSGKTFQGLTGVLSGGSSFVATGFTALLMVAGLDDFAVFTSVDVDPAISLIGYNNTGILTGTNTGGSAGYTRPYATFSAPENQTGSSGKLVWNAASYFAVGYQFASIAAGGSQNITHVQAELVPSTGTPVVPSAFIRPRALTAVLAPSRLNYVQNPSFETIAGTTSLGIADGTFETGVSQWSVTNATQAQSGVQHHSGSFSDLVSVTGTPTSAFLRPLSANRVHVVPGFSYTAGMWIFSNTASQTYSASIDWFDVNNVFLSTNSSTGTVLATGSFINVTETFTAPANAYYAGYGPTITSPTSGANFYVDDVTFTINNVSPTWIADSANTTSLTQAAGGAVTGSSFSMKVVTSAANAGAYAIVPNLIVGETYMASVYVQPTTTIATMKIQVGATNATFTTPTGVWTRMNLPFTAMTSNVLLDIQASVSGTFLVDAALLEVGGALNAYADGSFNGWNWENPLTPGIVRSYYYIRGNIAYAAVQNVLSEHLPMGLSAYSPVYNSPPTQYSA